MWGEKTYTKAQMLEIYQLGREDGYISKEKDTNINNSQSYLDGIELNRTLENNRQFNNFKFNLSQNWWLGLNITEKRLYAEKYSYTLPVEDEAILFMWQKETDDAAEKAGL